MSKVTAIPVESTTEPTHLELKEKLSALVPRYVAEVARYDESIRRRIDQTGQPNWKNRVDEIDRSNAWTI
jgi:hypothetical protein